VTARIRVALAGAVLACAGFAAAAAEPALAPFDATYEIRHGAKRIGVATMTLRESDDRWRLESHTQPKGIAKLFVGDIEETSEFELTDTGVRPLRFEARESRGDESQRVEFDWARGIAVSESGSARVELPLRPRTLDHALVQVALMLEVAAGAPLAPYHIVEKNEARTYLYERTGDETVETPAGSFRAVKVRQQREGSSRELFFWFAPDLGHLAVRVEQRKDGKPTFTMLLTSPPAG
jgi:hypothetical protein